MSFNKTGTIRVVFSLARINDVLFGPDVDNTTFYELSNLRLVFTSIPEDGVKNNTVHKVKYLIKQSILSRTTNISSNIPAKCSGVSYSFITQAKKTPQKIIHIIGRHIQTYKNYNFYLITILTNT